MKFHNLGNSDHGRFDMTPIIDIVFLLIIFFMIVCKFIVAENFEVEVPDDIPSAVKAETAKKKTITITVMFSEDGIVDYAVGPELIPRNENLDVSKKIAEMIDRQLKKSKYGEGSKVVSLRIDKGIPFKYSKHALEGVSISNAVEMKFSVIKQNVMR